MKLTHGGFRFFLVFCLGFTAPDGSTAQETGVVTGAVVDGASGQALETAQVFLPELGLGGLTNTEGRFTILRVPVGTYEIAVHLLGYTPDTRTVTVMAGSPVEVNFELVATALRLQELVGTGVAGETPRVKLAFTVERLDFEDIPVPPPSAEGLMAARVPGAKVSKPSGQPGTAASILFRGPTSITGLQDPLVIVDGVITENTLADIGALDVESIEIVKGAAASSLYGSRAQNGVIQIRTKRGQNLEIGKSRVILRTEYGRNSIEGSIRTSKAHWFETNDQGEILDVKGNVVRDLYSHTEETGLNVAETLWHDQEYPDYIPLYDQLDQFFDPGHYVSQHVAVEGRTGSTNYRASFTYQDEQGVVPEFSSGAQLKGFRLNVDHSVRENLNVGLSTYYARADQDDPMWSGSTNWDPFYQLAYQLPFVDLLRRDTSTIGVPFCPEQGCLVRRPNLFSMETNPLYGLELLDAFNARTRFLGAATLSWAPAPWFQLEGNFSLDRSDFFESFRVPKGFLWSDGQSGLGLLQKTQHISNDITGSVTAAVNRAFGDLTLRTRLRYLMEDQHAEVFHIQGQEAQAGGVPVLDNYALYQGGSMVSDIRSEGYYFISAVDFRGKYVGDFLVRRDGSSLFGPEERWQTYFRASGAWRLAQEDWWPFEAIDELKLRYSVGTAGGRPRFNAQYETYQVSSAGIFPTTLGNKKLKPELTTEQEAGVEFVLLDQITGGALYAWSTTEDQLLQQPLSSSAGFASQWVNAGAIESNTWEAWVEAALMNRPEVTWTSRLNFDRTRQKIGKLNIFPYRERWFFVREGETLGSFYGNIWATRCDQLPVGSPCDQFQVNDDGILVWVGPGNQYTEGFSKDLWFTSDTITTAAEDGSQRDTAYRWGYPIKALGLDYQGKESDFLYLGNSLPNFNLSWVNTLRWKGLTLFTVFDGEFGAEVYNHTRSYPYRDEASGDQDQHQKPDELKKPTPYYQVLYNTNDPPSSWFVEDGTFIKLREMAIRYTFNPDRVRNWFGGAMGLSGLSLSIIGRNLITWTDYVGYDPEVGMTAGRELQNVGGGSPIIARVDSFGYPNFRAVSVSVEAIF